MFIATLDVFQFARQKKLSILCHRTKITIFTDTVQPISYDLRYSNTCTLKCRMCNSSSSSALNAEYKKIKDRWPEKFWTVDNHRINHEIKSKAISAVPISPDSLPNLEIDISGRF